MTEQSENVAADTPCRACGGAALDDAIGCDSCDDTGYEPLPHGTTPSVLWRRCALIWTDPEERAEMYRDYCIAHGHLVTRPGSTPSEGGGR